MKSTPPNIPFKPLIAGIGGGILESYDFYIFALLIPTLSPLFFPAENTILPILMGYLTFSLGFFFRPLGSVFFGHIGDRLGRRTALYLCLMLMAVSTLIMGIAPTYQSIGLFAPLLIIIARMLQGLSAGGEIAGGLTFIVEHTDRRYTGFVAGMGWSGINIGIFMGSCVALLFTLPNMPEWSWRVPFILGFLIALIGLYIRCYLPETPSFIETKKKGDTENIPLLKGIKDFHKHMAFSAIIISFAGSVFFFNVVALPQLFMKLFSISEPLSQLSNMIQIFTLIIALPIFGLCADKIGKFRLSKIAIPLLSAFTLIGIYFLSTKNLPNITSVFLYQIFSGIFLALNCAATHIFLLETFDTKIRYTCFAISYNVGLTISGTSPFLVTLLLHHQNYLALSACATLMGLFALLSIYGVERLRKKSDCKTNYRR